MNLPGLLLLSLIALVGGGAASAQALRLPALFSDHMVLQSEQADAVWGWAAPGAAVRVELLDPAGVSQAQAEAGAGADGKWLARLPALPAGTAGHLRVAAGGEEKRVADVLVGEAWLGGGQSNMSYLVSDFNTPPAVVDRARAEARASGGAIRYFETASQGTDTPQDDVKGVWRVATPETVPHCSSTAWNFAVALHDARHRPVGMIVSAVGGTPAEAWLPKEELLACAVGPQIWQRHEEALSHSSPDQLPKYQADLAAWKAQYPTPQLQADNNKTKPAEPYSPRARKVPVQYYNGMIHGLEPYTVKGVIWFQADGNSAHPDEYPELIRTLIRTWRAHWGAELPFYYVEMNNMGKGQQKPVEPASLCVIREAQQAALALPETGVAAAIDVGVENPHFPDKKEVGNRLAGLALRGAYGIAAGEADSPSLAGYAVEGDQVRLRLDHAAGLRVRGGGEVQGFAIRGETGDWQWAEGRIEAPAAGSAAPRPSGLAAKLQPFVDAHTLAGAVMLVAGKDRVLDVESVGCADLAAKKPMADDALFWIASTTKPMTCTALMMLVDEGKVNVDDPVEKYLPEFKGQKVADPQDPSRALQPPVHPIRVRDLLTHTSGLPPYSPAETPTLDLLPLREAVLGHAKAGLKFQPGTQYEYSNAGINTVGRIVEVVSGMPYERFMDQRLFQPLGMSDTTFWPDAGQLRRLAKSYKANPAKDGLEETPIKQLHYPLDDRRVRFPMPAGGLFSTARDVAKFGQMILNGGVLDGKRYLSEAAVARMTTRQTGPDLKQSYGFGWHQEGTGFGHPGAYKTDLRIDPQLGLVTVLLVQQGSDWPNQAGNTLLTAFREAAATWAAPAADRNPGPEVVVWNAQVPAPQAVRYGWAQNPVISLENGAGLPLRPFRTDTASPR